MRIGIVAPSARIDEGVAARVTAIAAERHGDAAPELVFHPQCHLSSGHFAGDDGARAAAFIEVANDPGFDALWFARGGYGACRLAEAVLPKLTDAARTKRYLGYSDAGFLIAGMYARGFTTLAHGPMASDVRRDGGEAAIERALAWLVDQDPATLEPHLSPEAPAAAFNLTVLSQLVGTPFQPDLAGHVLMLEETEEQMYRIDRYLFHVTSNPAIRRIAGLRLGRVSDVIENDPDFAQTEEQVIAYWCETSGIPYLGRADIGHDADNKIVPFGIWPPG
jgi:muramoyltetrapeptide carboxypeptidase